MKKIKTISLTLALIELLTIGKYALKKNTKEEIIPKSSIESIVDEDDIELNNVYKMDNNGETVYYRLEESGQRKNISIFDEENISSKQYGASQIDFRERFDYLINEELIWNELQNYFPVNEFNSLDEAMAFYKEYFELITECGCGYAAAADFAFRLFEGREKEFQKAFGYPMYSVDDDNNIDFNYEVFMLKFFNYSVIKSNEIKNNIICCLLNDYYFYEIQELLTSEEYKIKLPDDFDTWNEEDWKKWDEFDEARNKKYYDLYEKWNKGRNMKVSFGIPIDASFGNFYNYLLDHRINVVMSYCDFEPTSFEINDIVASDEFDLYKINSDDEIGEVLENVESHYVYVSEVTYDNKIIVSSWGEKYIFENDNANWTTKIKMKTKNK